jgi:hypothetical protein
MSVSVVTFAQFYDKLVDHAQLVWHQLPASWSPTVDYCQTFGHYHFEMCAGGVMFCAFVNNFAQKQVEY